MYSIIRGLNALKTEVCIAFRFKKNLKNLTIWISSILSKNKKIRILIHLLFKEKIGRG